MTHSPNDYKPGTLNRCLANLEDYVRQAVQQGQTFHQFEHTFWQLLLAVGNAATATFLDAQGTGDLGSSVPLTDTQTVQRLPQEHPRSFTCVFGTFTLSRTCYGSREGQKIDFVPLDTRLDLPAGKFSYLLQDFNALLGTEQPFGQVAVALERILGLRQHVDSLERQGQHMATQVEPFRDAQPAPPPDEEAQLLVRSADAKGVPMRCAADAPPIHSHDHKRGPKTGRKRQAIVGAVYSVAPVPRTADDILERLFRAPDQPPPPTTPRPEVCHKRVMTRLNAYTDPAGTAHDGLAEVFTWMAEELRSRNPHGDKVILNLMDGDERLQKAQRGEDLPGRQVAILDLLHVTPKLWKAARLLTEDSVAAEAHVRVHLRKVLRGQVGAVVRGLKAQGEQAGLHGAAKKHLATIVGYLSKRRQQMRYHDYLQAGYPIASGVIEGACRHYVKDRLERTGMSWKEQGAQAMLDLRSVALNGVWDDFQSFYRQRESEVLYPHRHLLAEVEWPLAV